MSEKTLDEREVVLNPNPDERTIAERKMYLGDGLYASFDGYHVVLSAEDGISVSNEVYLESSVARAAIKYMEKVFGLKKEPLE